MRVTHVGTVAGTPACRQIAQQLGARLVVQLRDDAFDPVPLAGLENLGRTADLREGAQAGD
jgi:hypothetical protein